MTTQRLLKNADTGTCGETLTGLGGKPARGTGRDGIGPHLVAELGEKLERAHEFARRRLRKDQAYKKRHYQVY